MKWCCWNTLTNYNQSDIASNFSLHVCAHTSDMYKQKVHYAHGWKKHSHVQYQSIKVYVPFQENDRFTVNRFIKKRYYYGKETQRSRHPEIKWNVQKRTERNVLRTVYTRSVKKRQRSSFRVSEALQDKWAKKLSVQTEQSSFETSLPNPFRESERSSFKSLLYLQAAL